MADLSEIWFGNASGIKQTDLIAEYIFESGVYGTKHNNILNQINKNGKYKYILNRLFPNINIMKESFPILKGIVIYYRYCGYIDYFFLL